MKRVVSTSTRPKRAALGVAALALCALLALGAVLPGMAQPEQASAAQPEQSRPNIVVIMTDDQDPQSDLLNSMQHLQTLLVAAGMSFDNFFAPVPLCCPARATMLRGEYSHNTQILQNTLPIGGFPLFYQLGLENATYATALKGAGYQTALIGKYLNEYPNQDNLTYIPPGWDEWLVPITTAYGSYEYYANDNGVITYYGNTPADHISDVITNRALDFISHTAATSPTTPLFVQLNYYAPHSPAIGAPRHLGMFPNAQVPRVPSFNESDMSDKPPFMQTMPLLNPTQIANIDGFRRRQLQSLQSVDEGIAAVVQMLQDLGRLDNTYIIFLSDNGLKMGQHRFGISKGAPYEEDIRVPLIIRGPGVPAGVVRSELASMVDIASTLADMAGTAMAIPTDGRSLLPLLNSTQPPAVWRKVLLLEHWSPPPAVFEAAHPGSEPPDPGDWQVRELLANAGDAPLDLTIPDWTGVRTDEYKYIRRVGPARELYDMVNDRYELYSQYPDATTAFINQLNTRLNALYACAGDTCRSIEELPAPVFTLLYHRADMNRDGQVNLTDVVMAADCWRQPVLGSCGDRFDMNYDAQIDVVDIMRIVAAWNGLDRAAVDAGQ